MTGRILPAQQALIQIEQARTVIRLAMATAHQSGIARADAGGSGPLARGMAQGIGDGVRAAGGNQPPVLSVRHDRAGVRRRDHVAAGRQRLPHHTG